MAKSDMSVQELIDKIHHGNLVLPEIQRRYVWQATRVRDLLDSLYRGYPSGSILVWETDNAAPVQDMSVQQEASPLAQRLLLLDGQQRLTSLYAVIRGEKVKVRGRRKPVDILFNLEHGEGGPMDITEVDDDTGNGDDAEDDDADAPEDDGAEDVIKRMRRMTFVVSSGRLAALPTWVSVSEVFKNSDDRPFLKKAGIADFDDPRYELYSQRLQRLRAIRQYHYTVNILERAYSYETVAEIFVRVNSLGVKLRAADLAMAQISARWHGCLPLFEAFQAELEEDYWSFDTGFLLRAAVIFATQQCRFKTAGTIPIPVLQGAWEKAKKGLRFACNFLKTRAGIEEETVLSSPFIVLPVMAYSQLRGEQLSDEQQRELIHWIYNANLRAWYSSSAETTLDEDLNILFRGGSPADLTRSIYQKYGRSSLSADDFVGRGQRNPLFLMAFLALRHRGARDWETGIGVSMVLTGRNHKIEWHHIMPKALLQAARVDKSAINEIANMAFISGSTNRRIGKRPPAEYLPQLVEKYGEKFLYEHALPDDKVLWSLENYTGFLAARRELLAKAVNELLEKVTPAVFKT